MLGSIISGRQGAGGGVPLQVGVVDVTRRAHRQCSNMRDSGSRHREFLTATSRRSPIVWIRGGGQSYSRRSERLRSAFIVFAKGADVLVMHLAIAAGTTSLLHASPAVVGQVARDVGAKRLIVSHIGQFPLPEAIAELQKSYSGPVTVAADLQCTLVP